MNRSNGEYHEPTPAAIVAAAVVPEQAHALALQRDPNETLAEAQRAAQALMQIVNKKAKPVVINGEIYLEYEDWQMLGRFYGVTVAATSTTFIEYGDARGFEAKAEALLVRNGQSVRISSAEAMCLNDEWKWADSPAFQLRSMAQTRACAKALRNVLAWVVVLAGYKPTPAEEMDNQQAQPSIAAPRRRSESAEPAPSSPIEPPASPRKSRGLISDGQINRLYAIARDKGVSKPDLHAWLAKMGFARASEIPSDRYQAISNALLGVQ